MSPMNPVDRVVNLLKRATEDSELAGLLRVALEHGQAIAETIKLPSVSQDK